MSFLRANLVRSLRGSSAIVYIMSSPKSRLAQITTSLEKASAPKELLGELKLGGVSLPIYTSDHPDRLVKSDALLDLSDPTNAANLFWILQKSILGQDIFLYGPPGVYARRLALTYCSMINSTFEYVSLHRDVGEAELKQGREIREGGRLEYVDSAAVRAAKNGSILILDGIERAERGVLPILNNLLENREINLEDGTQIVSADRYELMVKNNEDITNFIPASREFRVIALGAPVPPFPGYPLDPPFRSRFQSRYLDPLTVSKVLASTLTPNPHPILEKTSDAITTLQIMREMRAKMASGVTSSTEIPSFPQTALLKLTAFLSVFPPPARAELSTSAQFMNMLLAIHPALSYINAESWRSLENAFGNEGAGLGDWTNGIAECDAAVVGLTGQGIMGWELIAIDRSSPTTASLTFTRGGVEKNVVEVAAGPLDFATYPLVKDSEELHLSPRFQHLLTSLFQLHALKDFDIAFLPASSSLQTSSSSTTVIISTFAALLGYSLETVHLYKELGGREIWMRRVVENGILREGATSSGKKEAGTTGWELSPLLKGALEGKLVHLEGIDAIGATAGSLSRLLNEREGELWEGKRIVGGETLTEAETQAGLYKSHPSFRVIATASKSTPPREWLTEELSSMFVSLPSLSMLPDEERALLVSTGCDPSTVTTLLAFARTYRTANSAPTSKARRLGTGSLLRIAKRLSKFPGEGLWEILNRTLLTEFLAATTKGEVTALMGEHKIAPGPSFWNPPAVVGAKHLVFPASSDPSGRTKEYSIDLYDLSKDPEGAAYVPYMNNYLDNSQQTALMRDIATDLEVMGNNILLMGNQGTGKNKIIDRLLQLMRRPREFIQLHRDSTTQSLMFNTVLSGGVIAYIDSPLIRAVRMGRVIVIDEVDKASSAVTAVLASLATRGEMTLADGRRIRPNSVGAEATDIIVHPDFRLILLSNRSGQGFLGNAFLRVVGDSFSTYSVSNPDPASEEKILTQLAPDVPVQTLRSLIGAFADLRIAFDNGTLSYPFSLRELLGLVRHLKRFPEDTLEQTLRNVFDFDVNRPETLDALYDILRKHKLTVERLGIDAVRVGSEPTKAPVVVEFTPKGDTSLSEPKYGKDTEKKHVGGNTWAGGTGGRDTAGLGGRGGYMRKYNKNHDISQIPDSLKADVPDSIKQQARDMARKELAARLAEIDMTSGQASAYSEYHDAVRSHVNQLVTFLDNLEASEEERVWLKRKSDGELDETRLTEGLTGEASIYKQRGMDAPELGRPQLKPKRIRFIFDCSASMYRNQYDGRLARSLETAVMIMEAFAKLQRKEKFRVDLVGQSGEEAVIPLVPLDTLSNMHAGERYKVIQRMAVTSQMVWSGDNTIEAIVAGVASVAETDSDDYFCIIITDANFERYGISAQDLKKSMDANPKVKCALIAIGEGAESTWIPRELPGRGFRVKETSDIATTLRAILSTMLATAI